ncbi:MAG: hypothetical protein G01um101416_739, partial [Microgenomates group bacterium Gr01-1014_16]
LRQAMVEVKLPEDNNGGWAIKRMRLVDAVRAQANEEVQEKLLTDLAELVLKPGQETNKPKSVGKKIFNRILLATGTALAGCTGQPFLIQEAQISHTEVADHVIFVSDAGEYFDLSDTDPTDNCKIFAETPTDRILAVQELNDMVRLWPVGKRVDVPSSETTVGKLDVADVCEERFGSVTGETQPVLPPPDLEKLPEGVVEGLRSLVVDVHLFYRMPDGILWDVRCSASYMEESSSVLTTKHCFTTEEGYPWFGGKLEKVRFEQGDREVELMTGDNSGISFVADPELDMGLIKLDVEAPQHPALSNFKGVPVKTNWKPKGTDTLVSVGWSGGNRDPGQEVIAGFRPLIWEGQIRYDGKAVIVLKSSDSGQSGEPVFLVDPETGEYWLVGEMFADDGILLMGGSDFGFT